MKIYIDSRIDDPEYNIYLKKFLDQYKISTSFSTELQNKDGKYIDYDFYVFLFMKKINKGFWKQHRNSIFNHFPCYENIHYKNFLTKLLADNPALNFKYLPFSFVINPKSYRMETIYNNIKIFNLTKSINQVEPDDDDDESATISITSSDNTTINSDIDDNLWLLKPYNGGLGDRILLTEKKDITENLKLCRDLVVVQKFIQNPLLLDGKKFHLRVHTVMIPIIEKNRLIGYDVYWDNNYFICTSIIDYNKEKLGEKGMYITNPNLQDEENIDNDLIYLDKSKLDKILILQILDKKIKSLCKNIFLSNGLPNILNPYRETNCYELFGLDIMLDEIGNIWLLEINVSPGMDIITSSVKGKIIPNLMMDMFSLVFKSIKNFKPKDELKALEFLGKNYFIK